MCSRKTLLAAACIVATASLACPETLSRLSVSARKL